MALKTEISYKADAPLYPYSVGRIRALEMRLLTASDLESMLETRTPEEALQVLAEFGDYQAGLSPLKGPADFEQALTHELDNSWRLVFRLSGGSCLISLFFLSADFQNLKAFLKEGLKPGETGEELRPRNWKEPSGVSPDELAVMVAKNDYSAFLPDELSPALREEVLARIEAVVAEFGESGDGRLLEFGLDRCRYRINFSVAERARCDYLRRYFKEEIDLINLKTFFRLKRLELPPELLERGLLPGGKLEPGFLLQYYAEPSSGFPLKGLTDEYQQLVKEGIGFVEGNRPAAALEILAEKHLLKFIEEARHLTFGLEPLIGFLLAKASEVKQIRWVMVGKLNQRPAAEIRQGLVSS